MMKNFEHKKSAIITIIVSILMILYGLLTKDYNRYYYADPTGIPLSRYQVSLFGWKFGYTNFLLFFMVVLVVGVFLYLQESDIFLKKILSTTKEIFTDEDVKSVKKIDIKAQDLINDNFGDILGNNFVRLFAFGIDIFITLALFSFLWAIFYLPVWTNGFNFTGIFIIVFRVLYFSFFNSSEWMGTPGKMLMGLKVVNNDGNKLSFLDALGRSVLKIISVLIFCIGIIPAIFGKNTLYDYIQKAKVVNAKPKKKTEFNYSWIIIIASVICLTISKRIPANTEAQDRFDKTIENIKKRQN